jgi:hypothetical protein
MHARMEAVITVNGMHIPYWLISYILGRSDRKELKD